MNEPARQHFSFDDYLLVEEMGQVKHEFLNGQVWAMAGSTPDHAALAAKVISLLDRQLEGHACCADRGARYAQLGEEGRVPVDTIALRIRWS